MISIRKWESHFPVAILAGALFAPLPSTLYRAGMPDNTAKIAELRAVIQSGAESVSVDGVSTRVNLDVITAEIRRLEEEDDTVGPKRPAVCGINLGSF